MESGHVGRKYDNVHAVLCVGCNIRRVDNKYGNT